MDHSLVKKEHSEFNQSLKLSSKQLTYGLFLAITVLAIASLIYLLSDSLMPVYSGLMGMLLCAVLVVTMPLFDWAPIYSIRFLLLACPGLIFASLVLFNTKIVEFAIHGTKFQTPEIASNVILVTAAALAASAIGWVVGLRSAPLIRLSFESGNLTYRFVIYGLIALIAGTFAGASLPDFIWVAPYSRGMTPYLNIGVFSVFSIFGVIGMFVILLLHSQLKFWHFVAFATISIYVLLFCLLLRGTRLDVMGASLGLVFVYLMAKSKKINIVLIIAILSLLAVFSQVWGSYRAYAHCASMPQIIGSALFIPNMALDSCSSPQSPQSPQDGARTSSVISYTPNTMGDVVSTLYQVIGLKKEGSLHYEYGETYFNYLKSTPPRFIYPDRPYGYSLPVDSHQTTGGSLYELAEAYVNFGFLGCILIPAFLTFLFGQIHRGAMQQKSLFPLLAYAIVLALLIRGTWYQNFTFYKASLSWILVELTIWFVAVIYWRWRHHS